MDMMPTDETMMSKAWIMMGKNTKDIGFSMPTSFANTPPRIIAPMISAAMLSKISARFSGGDAR
jgi:hypothetical protein